MDTENTTCERDEIESLKRVIRELESTIASNEKTIIRLAGIIKGLSFAIRCNGISGGDNGIKDIY